MRRHSAYRAGPESGGKGLLSVRQALRQWLGLLSANPENLYRIQSPAGWLVSLVFDFGIAALSNHRQPVIEIERPSKFVHSLARVKEMLLTGVAVRPRNRQESEIPTIELVAGGSELEKQIPNVYHPVILSGLPRLLRRHSDTPLSV